jgi:hypothetical protein
LVLLFISSYSPLFLILAVKDFDFDSCCLKHPVAVWIMLGLSLLSIVLLFVSLQYLKKGNMPVKIISVKNRSVDLINYTIPYILSFFSFDLSKWDDIISLSIFLLIMLILTITSKSIFLNPILAFAGYGMYDIEYEYNNTISSVIVVSKYELKAGNRFFIRNLNRFTYLIKEPINIEE